LEYFDDWKDNPLFLRDVAEMLDNVLQYFIDNAPASVSRAKFSAENERSIGIGALGFHAYLQKNNTPFESTFAKSRNVEIFRHIRKSLDEANLELGKLRGEAPDAVGTGRRFSHLMAIAPNASSSIIMGNTSPSVEPYRANAYRQDTLSGAYLNKNKFLDNIIKERCPDEDDYNEAWSSIIANDGSVQHLGILDDRQKDIFKTSMEIDQRWIVEHAADRQNYIDQAQSINLFFRPDTNVKYLHTVHFMAWKHGLKTLYYCRSEKIGKADKVAKKIEREVIRELDMKAVVEGVAGFRNIVYGTPTCNFCKIAKQELTNRGIQFDWIDLTEIGKTAAEVTGRAVKTVPQIYLQGEYIGGYVELMDFLNNKSDSSDDSECLACEG
jgi:ribonucleoside-diphosphate reductase alpha chain